jgi:hypothetical protein
MKTKLYKIVILPDFLYGRETQSYIKKSQMESRLLRRIAQLEREDVMRAF